jgi:hypothetical protein
LKEWIIENNLADEDQLSTIEREVKEFARNEKNEAWKEFELPIKEQVAEVVAALQQAAALSANKEEVEQVINELKKHLS